MRSASNAISSAEMLLGDALEIGGVVVAGEGVLLAADLGDALGELALRVGLGALEHQMFEEMGDARLALRIVGRAVAIPHHVGDHRRAVVGNDDHGQAVVEPEIDDAAVGGRAPPPVRRRRGWAWRGNEASRSGAAGDAEPPAAAPNVRKPTYRMQSAPPPIGRGRHGQDDGRSRPICDFPVGEQRPAPARRALGPLSRPPRCDRRGNDGSRGAFRTRRRAAAPPRNR